MSVATNEPFKLSELSALIDSCLHDASQGRGDGKDNTASVEQDPTCATIGKVIDECWTECSKESGFSDLLGRVNDLENKRDEIDNVFASCFTMLEEYKNADDIEEEEEEEQAEEVEEDAEAEEEVAISSDSSDDDVQFISTSFDPTKAKQQQEKQQQKLQKQQQKIQQQQARQQLLQQQKQLKQQLQQQQQQQQQQQVTAMTQSQQLLQQHKGVLSGQQLQHLVQQPGAMSLLSSGQLAFTAIPNSSAMTFQYMPQNMQQFRPPGLTSVPPVMTANQGQVVKRPPLLPRPAQNLAPMPLPKVVIGMKIFAKKQNEIWYKSTIVEITNEDKPKAERRYKIKFDVKGVKTVPGKLLAMTDYPMEVLPVGTRIIAMYRAEEEEQRAYYAGIVAEPPSLRNTNRYLTFFDDGYAQYCHHTEVHRVYEQSRNVWEDIHPDSQEFIKGYLQQYPERPMVRLQKHQIVKTEWKGQWWIAKVIDVDASLVKMYFEADHRVEWIYRGSTRLEPLYTELANQEASKIAGKGRRHNLVKRDRRPVVEYYTGRDDSGGAFKEEVEPSGKMIKRANVAKKSTAQKKNKELFQERRSYSSPDVEELDDEDSNGAFNGQGERKGVKNLFGEQGAARNRPTFKRHTCNDSCLTMGNASDDPTKFRGSNPLLISQLCGWERQLCRVRGQGNMRRAVAYRAPCGRRLRNMDELDRFLQLTDSNMTPDLFCFDSVLHTDTEYVPVKTFCDIKDLSYGKETVPISCVNGIDRQYPDYVEYSNQRIPAKGVSLNLDTDYLVGCDCTDGCRDRSKCRCCQMTVQMTAASVSKKLDPNAGYHHRHLPEPIITGIYECNSKCKCNCRCANRVAQNGLSLRLQVFKTDKRGWGLRCLDDIPSGGFICIYAGQLLTEQGANEDGQQYGDEYLAELDYIEVVERNKEGYESDVEMPDDETDDEYRAEEDSDSDYAGNRRHAAGRDRLTSPVLLKRQQMRNRWSIVKEDRKKKDSVVEKVPSGSAIVISDDESSNQSSVSEHSAQSHKKTDYGMDVNRAGGGIENLMITEPTSLNVDNEDSDSDDGKKDDHRVRRSARAAAQSRFSNLPDPKQQQQTPKEQQPEKKTFKSTRHYFGEEFCYVMDAKSMGNLGRYLNHSCSPNVFVQNVFVDTHDLRFPWVAFFASQFIRAGTELTWDYNYEVGSVPGKILHCYCGSAECRGRLL